MNVQKTGSGCLCLCSWHMYNWKDLSLISHWNQESVICYLINKEESLLGYLFITVSNIRKNRRERNRACLSSNEHNLRCKKQISGSSLQHTWLWLVHFTHKLINFLSFIYDSLWPNQELPLGIIINANTQQSLFPSEQIKIMKKKKAVYSITMFPAHNFHCLRKSRHQLEDHEHSQIELLVCCAERQSKIPIKWQYKHAGVFTWQRSGGAQSANWISMEEENHLPVTTLKKDLNHAE